MSDDYTHGDNFDYDNALVDEIERLTAEVTALKADQADWRKGVELIASSLGESNPPNLSCVRIAENALNLRAELERVSGSPAPEPQTVPKKNGLWYECSECGTELQDTTGREENGLRLECGNCGHEWWEHNYIGARL